MDFQINVNKLKAALNNVSKAVPRKATLPILETILFECRGDVLTLTATDLDLYMQSRVEVNNQTEGAVAIPGDRMLKIINKLPDVPITLTVDDKLNVQFKSNKGTYKLIGEDVDEFPELPDFQGEHRIEVSGEAILKSINKTEFATSTDDLRPAMMGANFEIDEQGSTIAATDGHRLVEYSIDGLNSNESCSFIIPGSALATIKNLPKDNSYEISVTDSHIKVAGGNYMVASRLITESYPNYKNVIPRDNNKVMRVNTDELRAAAKRVSIFAGTNTNTIRMEISEDGIVLRAEDIDMSSEAKEEVSCEYESEGIEVGFNAKYLDSVLLNADSEEVEFSLSTPNRAAIVTPCSADSDGDLLMLVMPVMINSYA